MRGPASCGGRRSREAGVGDGRRRAAGDVGSGPNSLKPMTALRFTVTDQDTALAMGSGDVPVLATPRLLAWLEAASVKAAADHLGEGATSVGVEVWMRHRRASAVGSQVEVEVVDVQEQPRGLAFELVARELPTDPGRPARELASGRVVRAVVDRETFLARACTPQVAP